MIRLRVRASPLAYLFFMKKNLFILFNLFSLFLCNSVSLFDGTDNKVEVYLGNRWFSSRKISFKNNIMIGYSGTKDFICENFTFKFSFPSKNRHLFLIRGLHLGFTKGLFSNNFKNYDFGIATGFEYLYKIFNYSSGFFVFSDIGGSNEGPFFSLGLGIGEHHIEGFDFSTYILVNSFLLSEVNLHLLFFNIFTISGKIGILLHFYKINIDFFAFNNGISIGIFIKRKVKIEIGGGIIFNDFGYISGFGLNSLIFQF